MITSFFVTPDRPGEHYVFFDTAIDGKHVFTACGVGRVDRGQAQMSDIAQQTLRALLDYANNPDITVRMQEIATVAAVPVRMRKALEAANEKEIVFFVRRNVDVYNTAIGALNPTWKTEGAAQ